MPTDRMTSRHTDISRHFVNKTLQNWLLNAEICYCNVFIYSNYQSGLKFLNFKLQILCVINWKKINSNKFLGNQRCKTSAFSRSALQFSRIFPDFSIPMITFKAFQGLENCYSTFKDFPDFSRICTNLVP